MSSPSSESPDALRTCSTSVGAVGGKIPLCPCESGLRSKAGWWTEGQRKPRAGLMVSMATWVSGGANNPVFQSSATLLWRGEKV